MLKLLVTGVSGFVGPHLVRELVDRGYEVIGVSHRPLANAELTKLLSVAYACDLTQPDEVAKLPLGDINAIINLAGLAQVGASFDDPEKYKKVNVAVLTVLGQELLRQKSSARVIAVSTGAIYDPHQPMPQTETSKLNDQASPYAHSKILMETAAHQLQKRGLDVVIARPFNHLGPGQETGFLLADFYEGLKSGHLRVGNLASLRDFTDVRDIVKAYADLATAESLDYDTYNVCSGTSHSCQEVLDKLVQAMGITKPVVEVDPARLRPNDPPELRGSFDRLREETGWEPTIPLKQTISDFVASKEN